MAEGTNHVETSRGVTGGEATLPGGQSKWCTASADSPSPCRGRRAQSASGVRVETRVGGAGSGGDGRVEPVMGRIVAAAAAPCGPRLR